MTWTTELPEGPAHGWVLDDRGVHAALVDDRAGKVWAGGGCFARTRDWDHAAARDGLMWHPVTADGQPPAPPAETLEPGCYRWPDGTEGMALEPTIIVTLNSDTRALTPARAAELHGGLPVRLVPEDGAPAKLERVREWVYRGNCDMVAARETRAGTMHDAGYRCALREVSEILQADDG